MASALILALHRHPVGQRPLQPLDPGLNTGRLARELVLAWESGAQPVVVLTKADLVTPEAVAAHESIARDFGGAGLLVLTSPDRLHTDWLRSNGPSEN